MVLRIIFKISLISIECSIILGMQYHVFSSAPFHLIPVYGQIIENGQHRVATNGNFDLKSSEYKKLRELRVIKQKAKITITYEAIRHFNVDRSNPACRTKIYMHTGSTALKTSENNIATK